MFLTAGFARVFLGKRLDLKSFMGQTKAEEPELLSLRLALKALLIEPFCRKNSGKTAQPRVHRGGTDPLLSVKVVQHTVALNWDAPVRLWVFISPRS